jgi:hypothetical protein
MIVPERKRALGAAIVAYCICFAVAASLPIWTDYDYDGCDGLKRTSSAWTVFPQIVHAVGASWPRVHLELHLSDLVMFAYISFVSACVAILVYWLNSALAPNPFPEPRHLQSPR